MAGSKVVTVMHIAPDSGRWLVKRALTVMVPLLLWEAVSRGLLNAHLVPPPSRVAITAWELLRTGAIVVDILTSLQRVFLGFGLGSAIGIVLGVLVGRSRIAWDLTSPVLIVCKSIPPIALIPLVMVWFGIDEMARVFLITYLATVVVVPSTADGIRNVPPIRVRAAQTLGASRGQIFLFVVLPDAFPSVLTGLRLSLGFCFMVVVAAEMIGATSGVGYRIMQARYSAMTPAMFVGLVILGVLGSSLDGLCRRLVAVALPRFATEKRTG